MLSFEELAGLRLRYFLPPDSDIVENGGWEWMNGIWHYEGIGFTWFGWLESEPGVTAGLELYFEELAPAVVEQLLTKLGLPLEPGMLSSDVEKLFGAPYKTYDFAADRKTYEYQLNAPQTYLLSCTVNDEEGLTHVSLIRDDVRRLLAVA